MDWAMPHDRLAKADELMRVVGLHRRKRRSGLENLTKAEAIIACLVQRFGSLPRTNGELPQARQRRPLPETAGSHRRARTGTAWRSYTRIRTLAPSTTS